MHCGCEHHNCRALRRPHLAPMFYSAIAAPVAAFVALSAYYIDLVLLASISTDQGIIGPGTTSRAVPLETGGMVEFIERDTRYGVDYCIFYSRP